MVTIAIALAGALTGYGALKQSQTDTKERLDNAIKYTIEQERRLDDNEKIDVRQSVLLENTAEILDRIEKRF